MAREPSARSARKCGGGAFSDSLKVIRKPLPFGEWAARQRMGISLVGHLTAPKCEADAGLIAIGELDTSRFKSAPNRVDRRGIYSKSPLAIGMRKPADPKYGAHLDTIGVFPGGAWRRTMSG
jgi:hypothetical protein